MNETYEFEGNRYLKPELDRDERLGFVDNLRKIQQADLEKINQDTYNLGAQVPSYMGGLAGSEGVWNNQFVRPQTDELVSKLKSTAQASALNTVLGNLQEQYKKRYNDAQRKHALSGGGGGSSRGGVNYHSEAPTDEDMENYIDARNVYSNQDKNIGLYVRNWNNYKDNTNEVQKFWNNITAPGKTQDIAYHRTLREYLRRVGGFTPEEIAQYEKTHGPID